MGRKTFPPLLTVSWEENREAAPGWSRELQPAQLHPAVLDIVPTWALHKLPSRIAPRSLGYTSLTLLPCGEPVWRIPSNRTNPTGPTETWLSIFSFWPHPLLLPSAHTFSGKEGQSLGSPLLSLLRSLKFGQILGTPRPFQNPLRVGGSYFRAESEEKRGPMRRPVERVAGIPESPCGLWVATGTYQIPLPHQK